MNRHTFAYLFITLFIGLATVLFVFGSPPLTAETLHVPAALTETATLAPTNTPVPVDTNTPVPVDTNTPVPIITNTPVPVATDVPVPAATDTAIPAPTNTPAPTATETATAPAVVGLPNTGGGSAPQSRTSLWMLALAAAVVGSLGSLTFGLRRLLRPVRR